MNRIILYMVLGSALSSGAAEKNSRFERLVKGLDLFKVPFDVKRVMRKRELYEQLSQRGVKIRTAKEDYGVALETYSQAYSTYNFPKATLSSGYTTSTITSSASTTNSKSLSASIGFAGDTGWGLSYDIGLPKITQTTTEYPTSKSESDAVSLGLTSLTFRLLNGSPFFLGRNAKNKADLTIDEAKNTLKSNVLESIQSAENAFYDVLLKQIRVMVLEEGFASGQALLSDIKEMVAAGEADRLSVLKTELQIAQNETDLLAAKIELSNSRQALRDLIAFRIDENTNFFPDPQELKTMPEPPDLVVKNAMARAKTQRPGFLNAVIGKRKAELDLQSAESGVLPALNISFSYGYSGSGSTFNEAKDQAMLFTSPTSSVGLQFTYNFFNDPAWASRRSARLTLHRAEVQVEQALNQMTKEISTAVVGVEMGQRRLKMAEMSRQLSEKKLASEFEKFRVGESKIKDVIDFQNEVNNSRISELNARVDYVKAITSLRTAIGDFPEGVSLIFSP